MFLSSSSLPSDSLSFQMVLSDFFFVFKVLAHSDCMWPKHLYFLHWIPFSGFLFSTVFEAFLFFWKLLILLDPCDFFLLFSLFKYLLKILLENHKFIITSITFIRRFMFLNRKSYALFFLVDLQVQLKCLQWTINSFNDTVLRSQAFSIIATLYAKLSGKDLKVFLTNCTRPILSGLLYLFSFLGLGPICGEFRIWTSNLVLFFLFIYFIRVFWVVMC